MAYYQETENGIMYIPKIKHEYVKPEDFMRQVGEGRRPVPEKVSDTFNVKWIDGKLTLEMKTPEEMQKIDDKNGPTIDITKHKDWSGKTEVGGDIPDGTIRVSDPINNKSEENGDTK